MPTNALENPLVLPILGLLTERPAHGYGLYAVLRDRYHHLKVSRSTVYTLVNRLRDSGWVTLGSEATPPKYAITPAGTTALAELVAHALRSGPPGPSEGFTTAVAYLGILDPQEAVSLLDQRRAHTQDAVKRLQQALVDYPAPELHMIEVRYRVATLANDAQWLETTARRIRSGDLEWPSH